MTRDLLTYAEACRDGHLFAPWFNAGTWATWQVLDKAIFGLPLSPEELATFRELTGREEPPSEPANEVWIIAGRRAGKDVKAASIAVYLATIGAELYGYRQRLTRGERGVVQVLAVDREQARVCMGYTKAFFEQPMLARLVERETADGLDLTNQLAIEITTNDRRRVRGRTVVAAIFDEVAHWRAENSVNPDEEIYRAVRPAMATVPCAMLIGISSPYARRGLLWQKYRAHFGRPGPVLVVQAPTWRLNPTLPRHGDFLTRAFDEDPAAAAAEYGADFRADLEAFVAREVVEAAVSEGTFERPPLPRVRYVAFVDPSGGRGDSMTLCVAHREGDTAVLDLLREARPPFSPEDVVGEFARELRHYRVTTASADRYGAEWVRTAFRRHGIELRPAAKPKGELYLDMLAPLNSGMVSLLDSERLVAQLCALERRTARGARDTVDHPPGAHDDLANAAAGAVFLAVARKEHKPRLPGAPVLIRPGGRTRAPLVSHH